jgi:hypothetical protein
MDAIGRGVALTAPLDYRVAFSPSDLQVPPDGIILRSGGGIGGNRY